MLERIGDIGFLTAASMLLCFSILFLTCVTWWKDLLGRVIALILGVMVTIMILASLVVFDVPIPGKMWWRAFLYNLLAFAMFLANVAFVWSQFIAPRRKKRQGRTTPPEKEEVRQ